MKKTAAVVTGAIMALSMAAPAFADAEAEGVAVGSPGVLSGNVIQVPVHIPVNVCGNTINVIALLNPTAGNSCEND
ncbi:chaplin [Streptomyces sp. NBC_00289]|uniref:chaplin n=1 Tax=Streptomyces sp. NBC_00289 TaxID=2975703 RepID=UPI003249A103